MRQILTTHDVDLHPVLYWPVSLTLTLPVPILGSLSNNVFERRTSTGSGLFWFFDGGFAQIFSQIASITVKKLRNTNFISSRHVKRENTSLPVDVRRSKTPLLKLHINTRDTTFALNLSSGSGDQLWHAWGPGREQTPTPAILGQETQLTFYLLLKLQKILAYTNS